VFPPLCVVLFYYTDVGESLQFWDFLKGGPRSTYSRNRSPICHLALSPFREPRVARSSPSIVCVLICFIKPILGNHYGAGVSSRASQRGRTHDPRSTPVCVLFCWRIEFLFKTDSGYPKDTGFTFFFGFFFLLL